MAYPYKHRSTAPDITCIELHKAGSDAGTPVNLVGNVTASGDYTMNVNLPYNGWELGFMFWVNAPSHAISLQIKPYIDHAQTILGGAMALSPYGTSASATVLTVAATSANEGFCGQVLSGTGALAALGSSLVLTHGIRVEITAATNTTSGTFDVEVLGIPKA